MDNTKKLRKCRSPKTDLLSSSLMLRVSTSAGKMSRTKSPKSGSFNFNMIKTTTVICSTSWTNKGWRIVSTQRVWKGVSSSSDSQPIYSVDPRKWHEWGWMTAWAKFFMPTPWFEPTTQEDLQLEPVTMRAILPAFLPALKIGTPWDSEFHEAAWSTSIKIGEKKNQACRGLEPWLEKHSSKAGSTE